MPSPRQTMCAAACRFCARLFKQVEPLFREAPGRLKDRQYRDLTIDETKTSPLKSSVRLDAAACSSGNRRGETRGAEMTCKARAHRALGGLFFAVTSIGFAPV